MVSSFCVYVGIDGQADMKLIYGIIVAEGKGNQGRVAKVNIIQLFILFIIQYYFPFSCTNFDFVRNTTIFSILFIIFQPFCVHGSWIFFHSSWQSTWVSNFIFFLLTNMITYSCNIHILFTFSICFYRIIR